MRRAVPLEVMKRPRFAHAHLRAATAPAHAALEQQAGIVERLSTAALRARMLQNYFDFYSGAAAVLAAWFSSVDGLSDTLDRRVERLRRDLTRIGVRPRRHTHRPELASRAQAFGFLYVIEGSSLGSRIILRELRARGADVSNLTFLDADTPLQPGAWSRVLDALETEVGGDEARLAHAIAGAQHAFRYAQHCLCAGEEE